MRTFLLTRNHSLGSSRLGFVVYDALGLLRHQLHHPHRLSELIDDVIVGFPSWRPILLLKAPCALAFTSKLLFQHLSSYLEFFIKVGNVCEAHFLSFLDCFVQYESCSHTEYFESRQRLDIRAAAVVEEGVERIDRVLSAATENLEICTPKVVVESDLNGLQNPGVVLDFDKDINPKEWEHLLWTNGS